jgi:hypothetical protein
MNGAEWAVMMGIATGLGLPGLGGLIFIVRMESRVTAIESRHEEDTKWHGCVDSKLALIARDVNRLIGRLGATDEGDR